MKKMNFNQISEKLDEVELVNVLKVAPTELSAVGDTRGIMTIFVKCTMDIGKKLDNTAQNIENFNQSTSRLTKILIWLNVVLTLATIIGAIATWKIAF